MKMETEKKSQLTSRILVKLDKFHEILLSMQKVIVAFSGGVDSTFLLATAVETLGSENVLAVMGISASLGSRERHFGRRLAQQIGSELIEIETCELENPDYASNPPERCFYCKQDLFIRLSELARKRGFSTIVSGANADDAGDFRPGLQAGEKLGVRNPLMEAGLTKADIRAASRAINLETWNKPAMACLASRIPYGQPITVEKLSRIEQAEYIIKDLGFTQCRVRDHGNLARVEVPPEDITSLAQLREKIVESLKKLGYTYVSIDLQGFRSGSMNEVI